MDNRFKNNKNFDKVSNIIESLTINPNPDSVGVLEEIGTNSSIDEVREMTSRALVKRNETNSLNVVISNRGKGINDMSTVVAMSTINELLSLENKEEAMRMLKSKLYQLELKKKEEQKMQNNLAKGDNGWGSQVRNYVLHPYKLVKDLRTGYETSNANAMLNGELLDDFIQSFYK